MSHDSPNRPPSPDQALESGQRALQLLRGDRIARLTDWKPVADNPALIGRATIVFAGGWGVPSIPVFRRAGGSLSVGPPSYLVVDQNGAQLVDNAGKRQYTAAIFFTDSQGRRRWNDLVLAALADAGIGGAQ